MARGWTRAIADRMDLTPSIRRHYLGDPVTPLGETLGRYREFFDLFDDFRGYVDFFLLQDLVTDDYVQCGSSSPFDRLYRLLCLRRNDVQTVQGHEPPWPGPTVVAAWASKNFG